MTSSSPTPRGCGDLTPHPAHTTERGHAPWHHCPGVPNLAKPAAQQPLTQVWDIEEAGPSLPTSRRIKRRVWIVAEDPAERDARVRADERRRVAQEIARALNDRAGLALVAELGKRAEAAAASAAFGEAADLALRHAAAPAERVQDAPTDTAGTHVHPRPSVVIQGNPCCGGDGDEANCEECR